MTIQEDLQKFLDDPDAVIVFHGDFKAQDYRNIRKVLENTEDDYLIFKNSQGAKFEIFFDVTEKGNIKALVAYMLENNKHCVYSYQIDNQQTILRNLSR